MSTHGGRVWCRSLVNTTISHITNILRFTKEYVNRVASINNKFPRVLQHHALWQWQGKSTVTPYNGLNFYLFM
jgi:hypothetical protein